jgi:hypothetical protein
MIPYNIPAQDYDPQNESIFRMQVAQWMQQPALRALMATTAGAATIAGSALVAPWSGITSTPTTLLGYGITNAYTKTASDGRYDALGAAAAVTPTTLGLVIGTNVEAYNAKLAAVAALANAAGWLHNDGAGAFAYSTPTAADTGALAAGGTAAAATKLATARAINGVAFDGTAPITIPNSQRAFAFFAS